MLNQIYVILLSCTILNQARETGFLSESVKLKPLIYRLETRFMGVVQDVSYSKFH